MKQYIQELKLKLNNGLPGLEAQLSMAPAVRKNAHINIPETAVNAAVLLLLYPKANDWYVSFIRRKTNNVNDKHSGQISFPGGKFELSDQFMANCALRETEEEIGVSSNDIKILGPLSKLYVPVSNFLIHPYVGFMEYSPKFKKQEEEVEDVLEFPLSYLSDPSIRKTRDISIRGITLKDVPYYDLHQEVLWGATAMMLSEFLAL